MTRPASPCVDPTKDGLTISRVRALPRQARRTSRTCCATRQPHGRVGIGHTRWATHGRPSDENAHPHKSGGVSRGAQRHHREPLGAARARSSRRGASSRRRPTPRSSPTSSTRSSRSTARSTLREAVRRALKQVQGAYAIVVMADSIAGSRSSPPRTPRRWCSALGDGENFVASDMPAILDAHAQMMFLEEGEIAEVRKTGIEVIDLEGRKVERAAKEITWSAVSAEKAGYKHFMLKEIHEQARAVTDTLRGRLSVEHNDAFLDGIELDVGRHEEGHDHRLRHVVARGARRQVPDRAARARAGRGRSRRPSIAIAIRSSARATCCWRSRSRARRPTRWRRSRRRRRRARTAMCIANVVDSSIPRACHALALHARGPRDRRRLDQGVHHAAGGAGAARDPPRAAHRGARR